MFDEIDQTGDRAAAARAAKAALRASITARLKALPADVREEAAQQAAEHLLVLVEELLPAGLPLALYAATPTELDSAPAARLLAARHPLLFPRVEGDRIRFHRAPLEALVAHASLVREPFPHAPEETPALVVVPGRAFDRFGVRLGRGKGFYDRTLAALAPDTPLIGYCFDFQVVEELPRFRHDRWVEHLVTERGARRCQTPPPQGPPEPADQGPPPRTRTA